MERTARGHAVHRGIRAVEPGVRNLLFCRARRRADRDGGALHARGHGATGRSQHHSERPPPGRAERAAQRPVADGGIEPLRSCDDGRRARQLIAAQRRAAGIPDRVYPNQVDARVKLIVIAIAALLFALPAAAQSTRVDTIAAEQAEKAKALGAEGPSRAETVIRRLLLSPLLSGGDGVYPWFGSVFGGSGMAGGVGFLKRFENASYLNLQSGVSINGSMVMRGTFATPELWRDMLQMDANVQWLDAKSVSFYGFGQDSARDARDP